MILHVEYDQTTKVITSCHLVENIGLKTETQQQLHGRNVKCGYVYVDNSPGSKSRVLSCLNNPYSKKFVPDEVNGIAAISGTLTDNVGPTGAFAREQTASTYTNSNVRPAAYRAGTSSFFQNL